MAQSARSTKRARSGDEQNPEPSSKRSKTTNSTRPKSARVAKLENGPLKKPSSTANAVSTKKTTAEPATSKQPTKTKTTAATEKKPATKGAIVKKPATSRAKSGGSEKPNTDKSDGGPSFRSPEAAASHDSVKTAKLALKKRKLDGDIANPVSNKKRRVRPKIVINTAKTQVVAVYICGAGDSGQLGLGSKMPEPIVEANMDANKPILNKLLPSDSVKGTVDIAVGGMHAAVLTKDNRVLTWGVNDVGALGRSTLEGDKFVSIDDPTAEKEKKSTNGNSAQDHSGDDDDDDDDDDDKIELVDTDLNEKECTPAQVEGLESPYKEEALVVTSLVAGDSCTYLVTDEGSVYGFGQFRGESGPLGFLKDGPQEQHTPVIIPGLKKIKSLASGANHVLALDEKGAIFTWGAGDRGQLGRRLLARGNREKQGLGPEKCGLTKQKIKSIAAGAYHSFAIDTKGDVWAWGQNASGQCGLPIEQTDSGAINVAFPTKVDSLSGLNIRSISAGEAHSLAVTEDGALLVWGKVTECQGGHDLGYLPEDDKVMVQGETRALIKPTKIKFFGRRDAAQQTEVQVRLVDSSCGTDHCAAITDDGKVYTWGDNGNKQCGLGNAPEIVKRCIEVDESGGSIHGKDVEMVGCGGSFTVIGTKV